MKPSADGPAEAPSPSSARDSALRRLSPLRDPTLLHQPVIESKQKGYEITISCNCRLKGRHYEPMGTIKDRYDIQRLYNDPDNHRKAFDPESEIHYRDVEG